MINIFEKNYTDMGKAFHLFNYSFCPLHRTPVEYADSVILKIYRIITGR